MTASSEHLSAVREIIFRAWSDQDFKKRLIAEPRAIMEEFGADVPPEDFKIQIIESHPGEVCFVLPAAPDFGSMTEADIREILEQSMLEQFVFPSVLDHC
jgi:hypothetical protein